MNSAAVRRRARGTARRRNGRRVIRTTPRLVVVPGLGRRRRNGRPRPRPNRIGSARLTRAPEEFTFTVDDLRANASGIIKFGPSLSQCAAISSGVLKSYLEYKIISVAIQYVTNAASTTAGAFSLEVDTSRTRSALDSRVISFPVSKNYSRSFNASLIKGLSWVPTTDDQFHLLYKGNGSSDIAGQFIIRVRIVLQGPK
uniref:Coat protein n=1 Tax=Luteovirus sociomali TaxID=2054409 RepID=A0A5J6KIN4_9TOMB|nr:coat protein [Luteovirus sociomali]